MVAPRGRPRKNCDWVDGIGWVQRAGTEAPKRPVIARVVIARPVAPRPVDPAVLQRLHEQQHQERLLREQEARMAQEEAARAEQERVERARKAAAERERLEAPRRYALQLHYNLMRVQGIPPPVYYFDVKGNFRELGKEPQEPLRPTPSCQKKKKRTRDGPQRVVGPRQTKSGWLSAGESEYISD